MGSDKAISEDAPFTFNNVLIDTSSNFNSLMGSFTCPDADYYVFFWTIQAPEGRLSADLVMDGQVLKRGPITAEIGNSHSRSSTMTTVLKCREGSMVWVKSNGRCDRTTWSVCFMMADVM